MWREAPFGSLPSAQRAQHPGGVEGQASVGLQGRAVATLLVRIAAAIGSANLTGGLISKLDLPDAPVVVRDQEGSSADSAAENVTRKALTPLEEAKAVQAISEASDIARYAKAGVI
jgi:hypothetical protein